MFHICTLFANKLLQSDKKIIVNFFQGIRANFLNFPSDIVFQLINRLGYRIAVDSAL